MNRRTAPALLAIALSGTLLIAGCSGSDSSAASSGGSAPQIGVADNAAGQSKELQAPAAPDVAAQSGRSAAGAAPGAADAGVAGGGVIGSDTPAVAVADTSKVVRTASMYLKVDSVAASAAAVRGVAAGLGGQVSDEVINATDTAPDPATNPSIGSPVQGQTTSGDSSTARRVLRQGNYGQLTVKVAPDKLDAAMDQLGRLGTVVQSTISQKDITANYVDTQSRIETQKASIERVRGYMAQTTNIQQLVELERQLTTRQADLDALQSTLNAMSQKVAMSTITVTITSNPVLAAPDEPNGFVGGLSQGWNALVRSISTLVVLIGAMLPWLIVAALLGYPLVRWAQRRRRPAPVGPAMVAMPSMVPSATAGTSATSAPSAPSAPSGTSAPGSPAGPPASPSGKAGPGASGD